ncbi:MAG: FtsW/RodA/SpoVE family cell cycle protein [Evtepia sp.]
MQSFLTQITDQIQIAFSALHASGAMSGIMGTLLPLSLWVIRITMAVMGIFILIRCIRSLFGEKSEREVWGIVTLANGTRYELYHWENVIGRAKGSDIVLDFPFISRTHAAILRDDKGNWQVYPLQTKNGTKLNGKDLSESVSIQSGDRLSLGGVVLRFYPTGAKEEQDRAYRRGIAARRFNPKRTLASLTCFQMLMALQAILTADSEEIIGIIVCFSVLCLAMWGLFALYRIFQRTAFEAETLAFFLCSMSFGVIAAYSIDALYQQALSLVLGLILFLILSLSLRDLNFAVSLRWPIAAATCALLIFNLLFGQKLFGARNWVEIGPINFQPSEFVKLAFVFTGAATMDRLFAKRNLIFTTLFTGFCVGCLALMSDFGTALIFFVAFLVIAFLRSGDLGFLVMMGAGATMGCGIILRFKPYIADRFAVWRHAWEFSSSTGYQQTRTMSAIAGGGLFGKGGEDAFLKKVGAANTDLVFGVLGEEFGLILAVCAVVAILTLSVFAVKCGGTARSSFYYIAACTAGSMLVFQTALNVFGSVDILPLTGVTFPFLSMGGSSMLSCWGLLAFLKAADARQNASFTLKRSHKGGRERQEWEEDLEEEEDD